MKFPELVRRVGVAFIGIPLIFFMTLRSGFLFLLLILLIQLFGLHEFYALSRKKGADPLGILGLLGLALFTCATYWMPSSSVVFAIPIGLFILILLIELFRGKPGPTINAAVTFFGFSYLALLSFWILLREMPRQAGLPATLGGRLIVLLLIGIWIGDTVAYFWGSAYGRHPLFKRVSPKKTWEGAILGALSVPFALGGFSRWVGFPLSLRDVICLGLLIGIVAPLSDLVESLFKRDAGVKDSSGILPGHGGFLDRFDSQILIGPLAYLYFWIIGLPH